MVTGSSAWSASDGRPESRRGRPGNRDGSLVGDDGPGNVGDPRESARRTSRDDVSRSSSRRVSDGFVGEAVLPPCMALLAVLDGNGVVIKAPGALDLGRTTRLANRAQRRALRGLYATCAIPGCRVRYSRTKLHHVIWRRHGGLTDLANLLPVCEQHHQKIHDGGWPVSLGTNRALTITLPDGQVMTTGPPKRGVG